MLIKKTLHLAQLLRGVAPLAMSFGLVAMPAAAQSVGQPSGANQSETPQTPAAVDIATQKTDAATAEGESRPGQSEDIIVTGSLLPRTNTETPSPVTVLTSDTLAKAGITTIADAVRSISADSAGSIGTGFQTGFSAGGSAVSLRGLGVSSTLVVIDGLRSANFPINDDGHNAYVDLNSIPFSLVDRIEVLKDGASSTYGADAIGGVVNIILKKQFSGVAGVLEGGVAELGDASRLRANLTVGVGDYGSRGWNFYLNGEYQRDGRVSSHSRGFPYNTQDLSSIGGKDQNTADSSLTTATPSAVVTRVRQTDLNNPLSGQVGAPLTNQYQTLNLASCPNGTYTQTSAAANGVGCKYDLVDLYRQLQPFQERYSLNGRLSIRLNDQTEGFVTGSYSRSYVSVTSAFPAAIRNTQPFGGAPALASSNPGIVLPVYVCSAGTNCATASDRRLNPNNPYAAAYANDPANGAARIYYLFGDLQRGSDRANEVYRATAGLNGRFGDDWTWRIEGVAARDNLSINQHGLLNIAALGTAINTGSYNFVNPSQNTDAVRNAIAPDKITPSHSSLYAVDASVTKVLAELPGGPLQLAIGGQVRREKLVNNNQNAALDTYALTTSSAFGEHTVSAGYFELDAPIAKILDVNVSGRYDHYSEGFSHFSPKIGAKFTPIRMLALRATYAKGFRAPTFAESGPKSQFAGFATYNPPANGFCLSHGGSATASGDCNANGNPYILGYQLGRGLSGNPDLKPETSRSITAGAIFQPVRWFSATVDYYNVKKSNLIVTGPLFGQARDAYYNASNLAAAQAAVAAVGPGYSVNLVDAPDPAFPNALPRLLILNVPFVNADFALTSGVDLAATANWRFGSDSKFTSRIEATHVIKYNLHTNGGVQRYAGTLGPYDLSSGNGTPAWKGNWQNTLQLGRYSASATAYYVGKIKEVSADQGNLNLDCSANLYGTGEKFCYVKSFVSVDLNQTLRVTDRVSMWGNVLNVFNARAPIAPAAYATAPNFLTTWHYAGLMGRAYRAGVSFGF